MTANKWAVHRTLFENCKFPRWSFSIETQLDVGRSEPVPGLNPERETLLVPAFSTIWWLWASGYYTLSPPPPPSAPLANGYVHVTFFKNSTDCTVYNCGKSIRIRTLMGTLRYNEVWTLAVKVFQRFEQTETDRHDSRFAVRYVHEYCYHSYARYNQSNFWRKWLSVSIGKWSSRAVAGRGWKMRNSHSPTVTRWWEKLGQAMLRVPDSNQGSSNASLLKV